MLSDEDLMRYSRQILVPQLDVAAQEAFANSKVLIVGAGGLGCPAALYLAGAGVGQLQIVDPDQLEQSNLHRQIAYREKDIGASKAQALAAQLQSLNAGVQVAACVRAADLDWLEQQLGKVSLVLDCSDNFATRFQVNQACVGAGVPLISAAAIRWEGQLAVFDFRQRDSACYACLYGNQQTGQEAALCSESGIVGPVVGTIGTMQALLALRLLAGDLLPQQLHLFDGRTLSWRQLGFRRDQACPVCASDVCKGQEK